MRSAILLLAAGLLAAQEAPVVRLTLKQAIDLALAPEGSARVDLARTFVDQSRARANQARAALLPNVDASVGGQNFTRNLRAFGVAAPVPGVSFPEVVGPLTVFDGRATLQQSIFDFAAIRRWQAAKVAIGAAEAEQDAARNQTAEQVARAYMGAARASAALDAARATLELAEANAALADRRKTAGSATGMDVTRAKVEAAAARQRVVAAESAVSRSHLALLRAIGGGLDARVDLADALAFAAPEPVDVEDAVRTALAKRAELVAQNRRRDGASLQYESVRAERYPSLAAIADGGNIGLSLGETRFTRTVGVSLRVPLFDGGRRDARRAEAAVALRQEEIRVRDVRRQIELEVRSAYVDLESAAGQVAVAEEALALALQETEQARRRFDAGVAPGIEVTDAQARLARARDSRTEALYLYNLAKVDLAAATGMLLSIVR